MPTYQYSCTECGHFFEQFQSFSDDALTECPVCAGRLRKVFNAVGVVFKGSGFYRNDSRDTATKKGSGDAAGSGSDSGSGSGTGSSETASPSKDSTKESSSSKKDAAPSPPKSPSNGSSSGTS